MQNITIIFTKHKEDGLCNINELCKIYENIKPDVIFEEIAPLRFDAYYKECNVSSLETKANIEYLKKYKIKNIPVDKNYEINEIIEHYNNFNFLNNIFFDYSVDYCNIWEDNIVNAREYGFKYLNSKNYTEKLRKLHHLEESLIKCFNSMELINRFNVWINFLFERDVTMLNNIYGYCNENDFNTGIFTVGGEHKISILNMIEQNKNNKININWIYDIYKL